MRNLKSKAVTKSNAFAVVTNDSPSNQTQVVCNSVKSTQVDTLPLGKGVSEKFRLVKRHQQELKRITVPVSIPIVEGYVAITQILFHEDHENWREVKVNAQWWPLNWDGIETLSIKLNLTPLFYSNAFGAKEIGTEELLYKIIKIEVIEIFKNTKYENSKHQMITKWEIIAELSEEEILGLNPLPDEVASEIADVIDLDQVTAQEPNLSEQETANFLKQKPALNNF